MGAIQGFLQTQQISETKTGIKPSSEGCRFDSVRGSETFRVYKNLEWHTKTILMSICSNSWGTL